MSLPGGPVWQRSGLSAPQSIEEAAKEDEWLSFIYGELDETSLYVMRRHGALSNIYGEAPAAMASAREYVLRMLKVVETALEDREFLLQDKFSLSDLFLTTCLNWVLNYELPLSKISAGLSQPNHPETSLPACG